MTMTIEANKKIINFLDIIFDLRTGIYQPYRKPNSSINYLHKDSNHPHSYIYIYVYTQDQGCHTMKRCAQLYRSFLNIAKEIYSPIS